MQTITITITRTEAYDIIHYEEPHVSSRVKEEIRRELKESKKNELRLKAVTDLEALLDELVEDDYY